MEQLGPTRSSTPPWARLLVRRSLQLVALGLLIGTVCFFMVRALPGDMAMRIAAGRYGYDLVSNAAADAVRQELGLHLAWWHGLGAWWLDIVRFDLGTSLVSGEPIAAELAHQLGATLELSAASVAIALLLGLPLGMASALRPGGWVDRLTLLAAVVLRATPPFLLAVVLMLVFAIYWGALPVAGHSEDGSLWLPALTLGLGLAGGLCRVVCSALREVMQSPACEFSRTKGLGDVHTLLRHGLRQASLPVLAYLGVQTVLLVEGAVVVETLFAWPGIGHALVHAVFGRDVPMIQGAALCMGMLFVVFNALLDAAGLWMDPRARWEARHG